MHGEYKTPRGKLVVADFEVEDGRISEVTVSGDFFLEPPEALSDIAAALESVPADRSEGELAARIRDFLRTDAEMVGFSPEAVARAVVRGLA